MNNKLTYLQLEFGKTVKLYIRDCLIGIISTEKIDIYIDAIYSQFLYIWKNRSDILNGKSDLVTDNSVIFEGNDFCLYYARISDFFFTRLNKLYSFKFQDITEKFEYNKQKKLIIESLYAESTIKPYLSKFSELFSLFKLNYYFIQHNILDLIKKLDGKVYFYQTEFEISNSYKTEREYFYNYVYLNIINHKSEDFAFLCAPVEINLSDPQNRQVYTNSGIQRITKFIKVEYSQFLEKIKSLSSREKLNDFFSDFKNKFNKHEQKYKNDKKE